MSGNRSASDSSKKPRKPPEIEAISVCGYKSIYDEQTIQLRPLTVLAGQNSSGKSSIIQPVLLLKQTLEAQYDPGSLHLAGPNVRLTSVEQLLSKISKTKCSDGFNVRFRLSEDTFIDSFYKHEPTLGLIIDRMVFDTGDGEKTIFPSMEEAQIESILPREIKAIKDSIESDLATPLQWRVLHDRCFLAFGLVATLSAPLRSIPHARIPFLTSPSTLVERDIFDLIHVPSLRGNPERTYPTTNAIGTSFPGTFQNYVASVITQWESVKDPRLKLLGTALETLGLTWKVRAKRIDDTQVELLVGRLPHAQRGGARDMVSIADVGFGVSQVLPVLAALLIARRNQIVYIQQPEIHLHPKAQYQLAQFFVDAANRGVKVIIETHSQLLLLSIQTLVAEQKIDSDQVVLHWFERQSNGATHINSGEVDETGAFGNWPVDFGDVTLQAENRYLDAAEQLLLAS